MIINCFLVFALYVRGSFYSSSHASVDATRRKGKG